ncbi:uncharacterized protein N7482_009258 [Penicillium canariense]|uniref:Uncharacterized protein n=1 Tax=Penicillium canariense TaxID=189055 RepID=A0A9W9LG38_9EURO|nr:uncharacterized protein N7482_009258 [Penicillium canariense]KAJ5152780.1 hypothetical protein N7482_009258 [Penicillium canariense]
MAIFGDFVNALLSGIASRLLTLLAVPLNTHWSVDHITGNANKQVYTEQKVEIAPGENVGDTEDEDFEYMKRV